MLFKNKGNGADHIVSWYSCVLRDILTNSRRTQFRNVRRCTIYLLHTGKCIAINQYII